MVKLTPDDHVDHSKFISFFNEEIVFYSTPVLHQALKELELELIARQLADDPSDTMAYTMKKSKSLLDRANQLVDEASNLWNEQIDRMIEKEINDENK